MSSQLPSMLNRLSSGKRKSHFHFDVGNQNQTEAELSLTESILKRQNRQLAEERHESIKKKAKIEDDRQGEQSRAQQSRIRNAEETQSQEREIEQKSIQILRELLFHPNRSTSNIINPQLTNQWILSPFTPAKIKSFLMLYMILYQFDQIKFRFTKVINPNPTAKDNKGSRLEKKIGLESAEYSFISKAEEETLDQRELVEYQRFVENERKKILREYLEWLVWVNRERFEREKGDEVFWAMAFNQCQEYSMQLMANKNPASRKRSVFLSMFLMNCQDIIFRSTVQIPKEEKMLIFMTQQNLATLPKCHWLLGLNFAIRYFYRKDLGRRVREALDNIDEDEMGQFRQEYDLLSGYFCKKEGNFSEGDQKLSGLVMEWLAVEGGAKTQGISEDREYRRKLSSRLCRKLLTMSVSDKTTRQQMFLISLQLLQRQSLLSNQQKDQILTQILYKSDPISQKLGVSDFHSTIKRLESHRETALPELFVRLTQQYDHLYRHWMLSNQVGIKFDVLGQLRHLVEIDVKYLTKELKERMHRLMTSFNIITHWNNEVLKVLVYLIEKYVKKLVAFADNNENEESPQNKIEEQQDKCSQQKIIAQQFCQLSCLATFLKLHLRLQPLTIPNLCSVMQLVKASSANQTEVKFEQRVITFIKRDILGMVFSRTGFNESLLNEIRKIALRQSLGRGLQEKYTEVGFLKGNKILEELGQMARGVKHFEHEISMLKEQVKTMEGKQQKQSK